jgi:hypothetical protein
MKSLKLNVFEIISILWIATAITGVILAEIHAFHPFLLLAAIISLCGHTWSKYQNRSLEIEKNDKIMLLTLSLTAGLALFLSLTTAPTIFGGRDEGSYSNAAIQLVKNHSLVADSEIIKQFFSIYGAGKALNFPGFYYSTDGNLHSQFLPGYISWLGINYAFGKLAGLGFANFLPFITFIFSFYSIIKKFSPRINIHTKPLAALLPYLPAIGTLLLISFFPYTLFYKFTLSEIYFAALAWFALYIIIRYLEEKSTQLLYIIALPMTLMIFTRIETIALIATLFIILFIKNYKKIISLQGQILFSILGLALFLAIFLHANFFIDTFKNLADPFLKKDLLNLKKSSDDLENFYILKIFLRYNLLPIFILGISYCFVLIKKKQRLLLVPLIFFLPTLIYLFDANISLDHPWMLRRFIFSIIPLFCLYTIFGITILAKKFNLHYYFILPLFAIAIAYNTTLIFPNKNLTKNFLLYSQNKTLLHQLTPIASQFKKNDLILTSQKASGNGWAMMSEPFRTIFEKQAVYFFNPENYEKIEKNKFENIYLIVSDNELPLYEKLNKKQVSQYSLNNTVIVPSKNPLRKPDTIDFPTKGYIFKLAD